MTFSPLNQTQIFMESPAARHADNTFGIMSVMFHPNAGTRLRKEDSADMVRKWLRKRFERLGIGEKEEVQIKKNAYNEDPKNPLGIQSVSVQVRRIVKRGTGREMFLEGETKSPTIGVIAPGLLNAKGGNMGERDHGIKAGIVHFSVAAGGAEKITSLSTDGSLLMDEDPEDGQPENPKNIAMGKTITVAHPRNVRTIVELRNPDPAKVQNIVHDAVYACEYLRA